MRCDAEVVQAITVLKLREEYPDVMLVTIIPSNKEYSDEKLAKVVFDQADVIIATSAKYYANAFLSANKFLIDTYDMVTCDSAEHMFYCYKDISEIEPSLIEVFDNSNSESPLNNIE